MPRYGTCAVITIQQARHLLADGPAQSGMVAANPAGAQMSTHAESHNPRVGHLANQLLERFSGLPTV